MGKTNEPSTGICADSQPLEKLTAQLKQEIEKRVKAEETLGRIEERNRTILDTIQQNFPDLLYCLDPEGCFTFLGGPVKRLLGYSPEELLGKPFQCLLRPEDLNRTEGRFNERRSGSRLTRRFEICLVPKANDREKKEPVFEIHAFGIYAANQPKSAKRLLGTYGVARNITDSRRTEEQLGKTCRELQETRDLLLQSEKLAAMGRLISGVVHEILNPVNIISMRLQMLKLGNSIDEKATETLEICENQVKRITRILGDLRQFSRMTKEEKTPNNLNEVVGHVLGLFGPQFKEENIRVETAYETALSPMPFARSRMEQVFFNVISNALEAMSGREKRVLTVSTARTPSGDHAQVVLSDTGPGIDIQSMNKIFEPFFTTKDRTQGTGLGLFLSYGIVKDHGGRIWAENNGAGGASFFIQLPVMRHKER